jgi:hypothetical protein
VSSARALANHRLYLAGIVLDSWAAALARQEIAASTLAQAFYGGAREHLVAAYGWFLVEITGAPLPAEPPRSCTELPALVEGKAIPGEIREFQQLERRGWLAQMLAPGSTEIPASRQPNSLAVASNDLPDPNQVILWLRQLEATFDRMSDSLDEY